MRQKKVDEEKPLNSKKLSLKKLENQVMVITGATSGIGLVTARMAAEKGAKLVLAARNEDALMQLVEELHSEGHEAVYVKTDVSQLEDVQKLAETAVNTYGGFDTWVNNASVTIYGYAEELEDMDMRQMFDVNFWGVVYGTQVAVQHYRVKDEPGAIINIGSIAGDRGTPILSLYSASKGAVRNFTDSIRMELEKEKAPISVTQIHPARIDTPYTDHSNSEIDKRPSHEGMIYPPESVAEAILAAAEKPIRDFYVGSQAKFISLLGNVMPRFTDRYMEKHFYSTMYDEDRSAEPPEEGTLYGPGEDLHERGSNTGWKRPKSMTVKMKKHPGLTAAAIGTGVVVLKLCMMQNEKSNKAKKAKKMLELKKMEKIGKMEKMDLKKMGKIGKMGKMDGKKMAKAGKMTAKEIGKMEKSKMKTIPKLFK